MPDPTVLATLGRLLWQAPSATVSPKAGRAWAAVAAVLAWAAPLAKVIAAIGMQWTTADAGRG